MMSSLGSLNNYFEGIIVKKLAGVEASRSKSNQHELNGIRPIVELFGSPVDDEKRLIECQYAYFSKSLKLSEPSALTLYDARARGRLAGRNNRSEYRLYFSENEVTQSMKEGDLILIGKRRNSTALFLVIDKNCEELPVLLWLLGISSEQAERFTPADSKRLGNQEIPPSINELLRLLGLNVPSYDNFLPEMCDRFRNAFPRTEEFSKFAREKSCYRNANEDTADKVLMSWLYTEESLFMSFERYLLAQRIEKGLDPDSFIKEAKSFMNRRYMRAGLSLENQIQQIFIDRGINFSRTPKTEGQSRPDFIFPGIHEYRTVDYPANRLHMLGVKTSCKDRWRQILTEADRIELKHLLTLQPGISQHQTDEMRDHRVQLVLPRSLHDSYTAEQQSWLMDVEGFLKIVK